MSGFIGNDGSELIRGLNPSNVVTAFRTNALGDVRVGRDVKEMAGLTANANGALLLPSTDVSAYSSSRFTPARASVAPTNSRAAMTTWTLSRSPATAWTI